MSDMPRGTVAFLFTDVENSSALWERDGAAMMSALARYHSRLREAVAAHGGVLFKTVGDGTQSAFPTAPAAIAAAVAAQRALLAEQRHKLGESEYLAAWEQGRFLSQERAVPEARAALSTVTVNGG